MTYELLNGIRLNAQREMIHPKFINHSIIFKIAGNFKILVSPMVLQEPKVADFLGRYEAVRSTTLGSLCVTTICYFSLI